MKLSGKFRRSLLVAMAITTAMSTVAYAAPIMQQNEEPGISFMSSPGQVSVPKFFGAGTGVVALKGEFDPLEGVTAFDGHGNDITNKIQVTGEVNTKSPGVYYLTYTATDKDGLTGRVLRVIIVDGNINPLEREKAEITGIEDIEIEVGEEVNLLAGVKAYDEVDGDLTHKIKVTSFVNNEKAGEYLVVYSVTNTMKQETVSYRTVKVISDVQAEPQIIGVEDETLEPGGKFSIIGGISAIDVDGTDITRRIEIEGNFDTSTPGTRIITYRVTDDKGRTATVIRQIHILGEEDKEEDKEVYQGPMIYGVEDITLQVGGKFSLIDGVTAVDAEGNSIMSTLRVEGDFNTSDPGVRLITYTAKDAQGRTATAVKTVTVVAK